MYQTSGISYFDKNKDFIKNRSTENFETVLYRLRMAQEIQRQLEEIEVKQKELEFKGVNVEKALRNKNRKFCIFVLSFCGFIMLVLRYFYTY